MKQAQESIGSMQGNILLDAMPECVKLINADGTILYINKAGLSFIDAQAQDEVVGTTVFDLISQNSLTLWRKMHNRVCLGEELDWEYEIVGLKGGRRFLETHAVPHRMPNGITVQLAITKDVTEKKRAARIVKESQEKLEASEARFRTLADKIHNLAWMADAQGNMYWYNSRWFEYTGTTLEEMKGWGWEKLHHPEHLPKILDFIKIAWNRNAPFELTHLLRGKDGHYRWFLSQGTPISDTNGNIIEWIGTLTDIDEQKRGEERFRLLADEAPLWVWLTDKHGAVDYANKETLAFFRVSKADSINQALFLSLVYKEDLPEVTSIIKNGYSQQQGYSLECRLLHPSSNQYEWFSFKAVPRLIEGRFDGFIGTASNIHVQKTYLAMLEGRVQERTLELNNANAALKQSNDELQQFAHVTSHDLKEPLRKISIFTNLLQEQLQSGHVDKAQDYAEKVAQSARRMAAFIERVLQYASVSGGQLQSQPVDLNQIVLSVETDLELAIQQQQASVILKNKLPLLEGAPTLLHQLFYNIINNALKFAKKNIPPVIELSTGYLHDEEIADKGLNTNSRYIVICIKDNGIGFDQSNAKNIFQTYYRLNSMDQYEGTGLGLSLCKKVAERHGGMIEAEGVSGEGALFKVILPVNDKGKA